MKKEIKDTIIVELGEKLKEYPHFYLVDLTGLNAEQTSDLRRKCFKNEVKLLVVKNKLLHKAFEASETDFTPLYECLKGNTALMFTQTANVPAKLIKEYKDKKQEVPALKGAFAEESFFVGADKLNDLVAIKSKNELIADVVALLQSPIKNVISGLNAGGKIHGLLDAIAERNQ
jgi:large subunit ribosomal protein L10